MWHHIEYQTTTETSQYSNVRTMYDSLVRAGAFDAKEGAQQPLKQYLDVHMKRI